MYLAYIDDYGNTGSRLDDQRQPVFALFAILVSEENWIELEMALTDILSELSTELGTEEDSFELHAVDFFSIRHSLSNRISIERRIDFAHRLAKSVAQYGGRYFAVYVDKALLLKIKTDISISMDSMENTYKETDFYTEDIKHMVEEVKSKIKNTLDKAYVPYVLSFSTLVGMINTYLSTVDSRAMLIFDRQDDFTKIKSLKSFRVLRHKDHRYLPNIIDNPMMGDGKVNILLQVADIMGYLVGTELKARLGYSKPFYKANEVLDIILASTELVAGTSRNDVIISTLLAEFHMTGPIMKELPRIISESLLFRQNNKNLGKEIPEGLEQQ